MRKLAILQRQFSRAILAGDETELLQHVNGGLLQPAERFRIYRNNVYEGFRSALATAFPVVERLVGQGCFRGLALNYVHAYPSSRGDLGCYGQYFAELLRERYEHSAFDYLGDIARLEWAYQEVMMAADAESLRGEDLVTVEPPVRQHLRLGLHPAVRLIGSSYPILDIWRSNRRGRDEQINIGTNGRGDNVVLYRTFESVELQKVSAAELHLLSACARGFSLSQATANALAIDPDFDLQEALGRAFWLGFFSEFTLPQA